MFGRLAGGRYFVDQNGHLAFQDKVCGRMTGPARMLGMWAALRSSLGRSSLLIGLFTLRLCPCMRIVLWKQAE